VSQNSVRTTEIAVGNANMLERPMEETSHPGPSYRLQPPGDSSKFVCETLRAVLPTYDSLVATLTKNGAWWSSFRQKTNALSTTSFETLAGFAARTYTSDNPAKLGMLVTAYARCVDRPEQSHNLYATVARLVISDFAYSATMDGLECLILLAKTYIDIGQPRRAWFMWRKGMGIAQLMV
jgi:hypothetical protein